MSLKPWREVAVPHDDVATGKYQQAEFAADLAQVHSGKAEPAYQDPVEFFSRTFLTEGMTDLLTSAVSRLAGKGGEPVVKLKTPFGGGKTHSMLALYHLAGGKAPAAKLLGVDKILKAAKVSELPKAQIAVLVGTDLNPTKPRKVKGSKIEVRTLWGEAAIQLGGADAYRRFEKADAAGVSPGAGEFVELFNDLGPCVILIDELVAYARNIYTASGLPAGSFESVMTFIQSLTEAVRRSKSAFLVASIPESDIEIGGEGGQATKDRLENTFGRLESVWKPVKPVEGFEIVRRRLFTPIKDDAAREEVCRAFAKMYDETDRGDFPAECREAGYLDRLRSAYPIHPEIFDRLYDDWSALERFQRTRGVLRLMAAVIHELWARGDRASMILPGSIPIDTQKVREELLKHLPDGWNTVIDKDVDGDHSNPKKIDDMNPRLGQLQATRRVTRTIFLGSAPSVRQQQVRGIEDVRVRLGVVQPGEVVAVFNDALGRLQGNLSHFYSGNGRFWFDTPPNLDTTIRADAERLDPAVVAAEIERRLRQIRERGDFCGIHICPASSADVPDEQEARLVVLPISSAHQQKRTDTPALTTAAEILEKRGTGQRQYRNTLVFAAPDAGLLPALDREVRMYLAWNSVVKEAEALNLDGHQRRLASESARITYETVDLRIQETYAWLLVPGHEGGSGSIKWEAVNIAGGAESVVLRAARKLKSSEQLITRWSPALLKMELDKWIWKDKPHVGVKQLWEYMTTYLYLSRLKDDEVFRGAIKEGLRSPEYFGYATSIGPDGRYQGLQYGSAGGEVYINATSVLVKPDLAAKQQTEDAAKAGQQSSATTGATAGGASSAAAASGSATASTSSSTQSARPPKRFHASVNLDPARVGRDAGRIAEEVVQHLSAQMGAKVEVTLEVHAEVPGGVPDPVVRTVTENCRTLKFKDHGFEEE